MRRHKLIHIVLAAFASLAMPIATHADDAAPPETVELADPMGELRTEVEILATQLLLKVMLGEMLDDEVGPAFDADVQTLKAAPDAAARAPITGSTYDLATRYLDTVEGTARESTTWPADRPATTYVGMAAVKLVWLREDLAAATAAHTDPIAVMREASRVLAWTFGYPNGLPHGSDPFGRHDELVTRAGAAFAPTVPTRPDN